MTSFSIKILVLMALFNCSLAGAIRHAYTQDWIQQTPYPADVDLLGVHFSSPTNGWISGSDDLQILGQILCVTPDIVVGALNGAFYRSEDGGENWTLVHDDTVDGFLTGLSVCWTSRPSSTWLPREHIKRKAMSIAMALSICWTWSHSWT